LWACFCISAAGGLGPLTDVAGGQLARIVGGSQLIALAMAGQLGERVALGAPVTEGEWSAGGGLLRAGGSPGGGRRAGGGGAPPALAARIRFHPGLPADRDQLMQRMPMGRVIKVNAAYPEPFWRAAGLSGLAGSDRRPLGSVFDNTPPAGTPGVLVGFLEG